MSAEQIQAVRNQTFYAALGYTSEQLSFQPALKATLDVSVKIVFGAYVSEVQLAERSFVGVFNHALKAIDVFKAEISEQGILTNIISAFLKHNGVPDAQLYVSSIGIFGDTLKQSNPELCRQFVDQLFAMAITKGDHDGMERLLGLTAPKTPPFYAKHLFPALQKRKDNAEIVALIDHHERFGELCVKNNLTRMVRYLKNPAHRGHLLEDDLGL